MIARWRPTTGRSKRTTSASSAAGKPWSVPYYTLGDRPRFVARSRRRLDQNRGRHVRRALTASHRSPTPVSAGLPMVRAAANRRLNFHLERLLLTIARRPPTTGRSKRTTSSSSAAGKPWSGPYYISDRIVEHNGCERAG